MKTVLVVAPDKPPEQVRCTSLSPQSIRVRWMPPSFDQNRGLVEGYKVSYSMNGEKFVVKTTTNLETTLHGLSKATNYTIRVVAHSTAGDGVPSPAIHCRTEEDSMFQKCYDNIVTRYYI